MPLPISFYIFAFLLGAVVGSFLNVCICRLPEDKSVVSPPSACPRCGKGIRWYDNIPIVSFLLLRARCRNCGEPISWRYPMVEALNGILTLLLFIKYGPTLPFLVLLLFSSSLVVITFIDLDHQIIPNQITGPGIVAGFLATLLVSRYAWPESIIGLVAGGACLALIFFGYLYFGRCEESEPRHTLIMILCCAPAVALGLYYYPLFREQRWPGSLLGIILGGGLIWLIATLYFLIRKEEGMGGGDVKLLAMMGAFLGWKSIPFIIFAASLVGSVIGITVMLRSKSDGKLAIPFGPFLAFGAMLYVFYGRQLITWYFSIGR